MGTDDEVDGMLIHKEKCFLADKMVKIKAHVKHLQFPGFAGSDFAVEDWWDRVFGKSWMFADGNPAAIVYALRTGTAAYDIPIDDEVLYGHTLDHFGHLVHITEIEIPEDSK